MGNIAKKSLSVRIAVGNIENLKGSGVLFIRNIGESALVFTAAHVIAKSFNKNNTIQLYLNFIKDTTNAYSIKGMEFSKWSEEKEATEGQVIIHPKYNINTDENDVAIIVIPWNAWMADFPSFQMIDKMPEGIVQGWGFPAFMHDKKDSLIKDIDALQYESEIRGFIEGDRNAKEYLFRYESTKVDEETSRSAETDGYSGTGIFHNGSFLGCLSRKVPQESAGSRLIIAKQGEYITLMKNAKLVPKCPESFVNYQDQLVLEVPREKKDLRNFVDKQCQELIVSKSFIPCMCLSNEQSQVINKGCKGFPEVCRFFWRGNLISAICFSGMKGIDPTKIEDFLLDIKDNEIARVVFVCTESTMAQSIENLMEISYFNKTHNNEQGILFIWNNPVDEYHNRVLSRKDAQNMVKKITEDYRITKMEEIKNKMDMFNIVKGDVLTCSMASIGVDKLWNGVIDSGDGDLETTKDYLDLLLKTAWRI